MANPPLPRDDALNPCPFCGATVVSHTNGLIAMILCKNCGAVISFHNFKLDRAMVRNELADAYNRRADKKDGE